MYEYTVSVTENFGRYDEDEVMWGPYSTVMTLSRPISEVEPLDVVAEHYHDKIEDVVYEDDYIMFDVVISNKETGALDTDSYVRYNYLVTERK